MKTIQRTNRRTFLQQSVGLLAGAGLGVTAPMFVPRHILGAGSEPAPSDRMLIGCIGVGNKGRENMGKNLKDTIAVCEVDATRLDEAKSRVEKANSKVVRRLRRLSTTFGQQRYRCRHRYRARSLALLDHQRCLRRREGCLLRKTVVADDRRGPGDGQSGPQNINESCKPAVSSAQMPGSDWRANWFGPAGWEKFTQ